MNRSQQASFSIKSTHRLINNEPESFTLENSLFYKTDSTTKQTNTNTNKTTNTDSQRTQGSTQGMAIRTTSTAVEDFH